VRKNQDAGQAIVRGVDAKLDSTRQDFGLLAYVLCVSLTESSPQRVPKRCTAVLASERR
jgi:hypothetical protein